MVPERSLLFGVLLVALGCAQSVVVEEPPATRGPVEAAASVDRAVATTGDLITYRIRVDAAADLEIDIPEVGADIAGFRIVDVGTEEPVSRGERIIREHWYQLRADLVGSYVLPPVVVSYRAPDEAAGESAGWQTVRTSQIFVEVESVLPSDLTAEDIRGLKPLRAVRRAIRWTLIGSTAAALAIAAALCIWYLRRRALRQTGPPPMPPHEIAFAALDALRQIDFDDPAAVRRFHFGISEVVRAYVEARFGMNATDLTTEEIFAQLSGLVDLPAAQERRLREFLLATDQVKFAHREPSANDVEAVYEQALGFVESTRPLAETQLEAA